MREAQLALQGTTESQEEKRSNKIEHILLSAAWRVHKREHTNSLIAASKAWKKHGDYLRKKRKFALKLSADYTNKFDTEAEQYGKEECFSVCQELRARIPQEILDKIYEYIVSPKTVPLVAYTPQSSETLSQATQACCFSAPFPSYSFDLKWKADLPLVWQCNEIGHAVLTELVKTWYRVHTFLITDFSLIADFAISDLWQLEVVPRAHITHIRLSFTKDELTGVLWGAALPPRVQQLRSNLERLHHFRPSTTITMDIISNTCNCVENNPLSPRWSQNHRCGSAIWERDACEVLEFVENLDSAVFGVLRKLLDAKYTLNHLGQAVGYQSFQSG